jgi:squalene-hopene/tetraprenyl-beta-curcumene cyclase
MDPEDERIQAVLKWLQSNFTLEENPGMEAEGLFYYYHTMSKALSVGGIRELQEPNGNKVDWKKELALKVMSHQSQDGSWTNEGSNRWMEGDPILVTAYSMLALQHVYHQL